MENSTLHVFSVSAFMSVIFVRVSRNFGIEVGDIDFRYRRAEELK